MPTCRLDHLTITAPSLDAGAAWAAAVLGVGPQAGGQHVRMGTHNRLLRLGDTTYLEVIAPDPAAPPPQRPRWFALDALSPRSSPALSTWVARTDDIEASLQAAGEPLGTIEPMSRGTLQWRMSIPADGSLPLGGAAPALIEWDGDNHPAANLEDHGLSLERLELIHPEPSRVSRLLRALSLDDDRVSVGAAPQGAPVRLVAHIHTPRGPCRLSSP